MICVQHQPYFFPWLGYFSKLVYADVFVVYDNVKFSKGHYIDRTKIINSQGDPMWIGVNCGQQFNKKCNEILINRNFNEEIFIKTLKYSYSKARYFRPIIIEVEKILYESLEKTKILSKFDIEIVVKIIELLALPLPNIVYTSSSKIINDPTDRIIYMCKETASEKNYSWF